MTNTYGIDTTQVITPVQVRDAIIECFNNAHWQDTGLTEDPNIAKIYCKQIISKTFHDTNNNFDNPTKQSLYQVISELAKFSEIFRDKTTIQKHFEDIKSLIDQIPDSSH